MNPGSVAWTEIPEVFEIKCCNRNWRYSEPVWPSDSLHAELVQFNLSNAELSPERYWRGPRSQKVEKEGDYTYGALSPPEWFCIKMGSGETSFGRKRRAEAESNRSPSALLTPYC